MNTKIALLIGALCVAGAGMAQAAVITNTCAPAKRVAHRVVHRRVLADAPAPIQKVDHVQPVDREAPPRVERVEYAYGYAPPPPPIYDDYYVGGYYPAYGYGYGFGYPFYGYGWGGYGRGFYGHGGYGFRGGYGGFHGGGFHGGRR